MEDMRYMGTTLGSPDLTYCVGQTGSLLSADNPRMISKAMRSLHFGWRSSDRHTVHKTGGSYCIFLSIMLAINTFLFQYL